MNKIEDSSWQNLLILQKSGDHDVMYIYIYTTKSRYSSYQKESIQLYIYIYIYPPNMHNIYIYIISFRYGENKYEPIIHHLSSAIGATTQLWALVTTGYFSIYIYMSMGYT